MKLLRSSKNISFNLQLLALILLGSFLASPNSYAYQIYFAPKTNLDQIVVEQIQRARQQIDIAIYTFRSEAIVQALVEKLKTNPDFELRLLVRKVSLEALSPYLSPLEKALKAQGLDTSNIRFVNVTNHHKFMLIDKKVLLNTSGNFNDTPLAASYDENLLVCSRSCPELVASFQNEFEFLYKYSNPLLITDEISSDSFSKPSLSEDTLRVAKAALNQDLALFTSVNFEPAVRNDRYIFRLKKHLNLGWVEQNILKYLSSAQKSIKVATGHLRSYTLANALRQASQRGVKVELILDGQEYLSPDYQAIEDLEKEQCLQKGIDLEDCVQTGFHFGRWLHQEGVHVYFKYYMISWDFINAPQMHHKYVIVDDKLVLTGSYNWSKNAEFKTFENKIVLDHKPSVLKFIRNFDELKSYGEGAYTKLLESWSKDPQSSINLIFNPMTLTVPQIDHLRCQAQVPGSAVGSHCVTSL